MDKSFSEIVHLIEHHVRMGEIEKSREQAVEIIQQNPESPYGYLLMSYHYLLVKEIDQVETYCREALQKGPEDEHSLGFATIIYESINFDVEKRRELVENALRLYPENDYFHARYAQLNKNHNIKQAKASFQEAIRLSPHNEEYLAEYAHYLYQLKDKKDAEHYEQLALQANPQHSTNLLNFAWAAYENKKYKKAQYLISEAMRLEPNDPTIREYYKKIHPMKNPLVRATKEINDFLSKCFALPAGILLILTFGKVNFMFLIFLTFILELVGLIFLLGENMFVVLGMYFLILIISHRTRKTMLKAAGLTDAEETSMKKEAKAKQKATLKEMKKELQTNTSGSKLTRDSVSADDLEAQLIHIWGSDDISQIKQQTVAKKTDLYLKEPVKTEEKLEKSKETTPIEWPKESNSSWPVYLMIIGILFSILARHLPNMIEESNRPTALPAETKQAVVQFQEEQKLTQDKSVIESNMPAVTQLIQAIQEGSLTSSISLYVSNDYEQVMKENIQHPLLNQLANAKIEKATTDLSKSHFLLVNELENAKAIVEVQFGLITHLYAENWSQSEEDIENYEKWLSQIDETGIEIQNK